MQPTPHKRHPYRGVIAYVTNGGWLDSNVGSQMRQSLASEFSDIHVYNLRGNGRVGGDAGRAEGRPMAVLSVHLLAGADLQRGHGIPEVAGAVVTVAFHLWRRNLLLSLVTGTGTYLVLTNVVWPG